MPTTGPALPGHGLYFWNAITKLRSIPPLNPGLQIHGWKGQVFCQVQMTYVPQLFYWLRISPVKGTEEVNSLFRGSCSPSYVGTRKEQDSWPWEQPGELGRVEGL